MIEVVRAFDRAPIAEIASDDRAALDRKLDSASRVFADRGEWLPTHRRIHILRRIAELMEGKREHLGRQIALEGGKPLSDALVETDRAIDGSAFNHPLNLIVHQVAPAIAVGCPVVVKPANTTPLSCIEFVGLVHEAGLPPEWCQTFLPETNELAEALATDPRVAFLSFIGSAKVGWYLRSKLPPGTRCALEHGGAAPAIIDRSADVDRLIEPMAKGGYYHAGQVCVSTQRVFVHADLHDAFLERFAARVAALRVGDPALIETEVGPLILPREADRVSSWIDEAVAGGARPLGGGRLSETTLLPSLLVDPPQDAKVSTLEVFGPTTCVYPFTRIDDAIAKANALPFAFQSSIFTEDLRTAFDAAERLAAAAVMVNDHTAFRTDWMPFAGHRRSGYGIGGIPWTMDEMSQEKMIVFRM